MEVYECSQRSHAHYCVMSFNDAIKILVLLCIGITNPPEDYVAYQDHDATFTCTAINTPFLVWKVNLTDLTDYPANIQADFSIDGMQENNEETIVLMVRSHCIYNNTQIQCEARNLDGELIQTEMAILFIQGKHESTKPQHDSYVPVLLLG